MNVTEHFNDEPIDYFKISSEDLLDHAPGGFNGEDARLNYESELSRITKDLIEPNEDGKVYDSLRRKLDLQTKNTSVINIGVGQGKTYTILKIVEEYFKNDADAYIIIAVPYVSLVDQYVKELIENGIPEGDIYRYEWLNPRFGELSRLTEHLKRRVHVVTANCLLGNAGEDAVINSQIKRNYLQKFPAALTNKIYKYDGLVITEQDINERLDRYSELHPLNPEEDLSAIYKELFDPSKVSSEISSKKVILIFDELHDAIHNFTDTNILNLYHWKDILKKVFLLSATFDDSSLVVINQLSELTDGKVHILESERKPIRAKQSDLFIHFDDNYTYDENNTTILQIVKKAIEEEKTIDILSYSKKLAKNLHDGEVGNLLRIYSAGQVKLCASDLIANQRATTDEPLNRYDSSKINIGTNFKTGININKDNHCFIIIMPSKSAKMPFENLYGIFSNGYLDIVQALARQRKKGEIHVVTMFHENLDEKSLSENWSAPQKYAFMSEYRNAQSRTERTQDLSIDECHELDDEDIVKYTFLNDQSKLISDKYDEILKPNIIHGLNTSLDFIRHKQKFRTEKGKIVLSKNRFFGEDISGNLTINAFTNQFINCRLAGTYGIVLFFDDGDFEGKLNVLYNAQIQQTSLRFDKLSEVIASDLSAYRVIYNKKLVTPSSQKFNKKIAFSLLKKLNNSGKPIDLYGPQLKTQHILLFILDNEDLVNSPSLKENCRKAFQNFQNLLIPNEDGMYLPTKNREIFEGIDVEQFYEEFINEFPILISTGLLKNLKPGQICEKKTNLYNAIQKTLATYLPSNKLEFSDETVKKLNPNSEILSRDFS